MMGHMWVKKKKGDENSNAFCPSAEETYTSPYRRSDVPHLDIIEKRGQVEFSEHIVKGLGIRGHP